MTLECQALKFSEFGPKYEDTGYDGSSHWKVLHDEVDRIECDFCKHKGIRLMRGLHDSVNKHLGKKVHHPDDLEFLQKHVAWSLSDNGLRCFKCQN